MENSKKSKSEDDDVGDNKIERKEAIKKIGYFTFSAATIILLLNQPAKGQDNPDSPDNPPDWP